MGILPHIDAAADELLAQGYTPQQAWRILCDRFPEAHSSLLAERVAAAAIDAGVAI
jgi:hypothetical protein